MQTSTEAPQSISGDSLRGGRVGAYAAFYVWTSCLILFGSAALKLSGFHVPPSIQAGLTPIDFGDLFFSSAAAALVELLVVFISLCRIRLRGKILIHCWIYAIFVSYHVVSLVTGFPLSCGCFGGLLGLISPKAEFWLSGCIASGMLGAGVFMLRKGSDFRKT